MKRKYETIYTTPPLESTMMIETGAQLYSPAVNVNDGNISNSCIGNLPNIPVSASLNNGTALFQYNQFFWNKDVFSFNYSNCAIFVAIAYYQGTHSKDVSFVFYPIFLPRTALATFQSLQNSVTSNPVVRKYLIDDLLYYLNGAFTSFNFDSAPGSIGDVGIGYPAGHPLYSGPSLYASYVKGFLKDPTDDHAKFPIFQDGKEPPLKFIYVSSNNQIALVKNPVFWDDSDNYESGASIAFQLVNPEMEFAIGTNNPSCKIAAHRGGSNPTLIANSTKNFFAAGCFNTSDPSPNSQNFSKGWCGQGAYGLGFGMTFDKDTKSYSDVFGTDDYDGKRFDLFNQTNWDTDSNLSFSSTSSFETWAKNNLLETFIVMAPKICSLLPSRYITVESDILTRDQKVKPISNNPALSSGSILSVIYLDLDYNRTKVDATQSGSDIKKVGSFTPVVHIDPSYSIQSLDLMMKDEFGNYIQNFRSSNPSFQLQFEDGYNSSFISSSASFNSGNYVSLLEGEMSFNNGVFDGVSIPAWLSALNPNTASSNTNPLVAPFSTYLSQFGYGLYARSEAGFSQSGNSVILKGNYTPNIPFSANIIHFGRLLGD